jgi:hypothetical protein
MKNQGFPINKLSSDEISEIFSFLPLTDIKNVSKVNKDFSSILDIDITNEEVSNKKYVYNKKWTSLEINILAQNRSDTTNIKKTLFKLTKIKGIESNNIIYNIYNIDQNPHKKYCDSFSDFIEFIQKNENKEKRFIINLDLNADQLNDKNFIELFANAESINNLVNIRITLYKNIMMISNNIEIFTKNTKIKDLQIHDSIGQSEELLELLKNPNCKIKNLTIELNSNENKQEILDAIIKSKSITKLCIKDSYMSVEDIEKIVDKFKDSKIEINFTKHDLNLIFYMIVNPNYLDNEIKFHNKTPFTIKDRGLGKTYCISRGLFSIEDGEKLYDICKKNDIDPLRVELQDTQANLSFKSQYTNIALDSNKYDMTQSEIDKLNYISHKATNRDNTMLHVAGFSASLSAIYIALAVSATIIIGDKAALLSVTTISSLLLPIAGSVLVSFGLLMSSCTVLFCNKINDAIITKEYNKYYDKKDQIKHSDDLFTSVVLEEREYNNGSKRKF